MRTVPAPSLHQLAARHGVQTSYIDNTGREQKASDASLAAALHALEIPAANEREITDSLARSTHDEWSRGLGPVVVAWEGKPFQIVARGPSIIGNSRIRFRWRLESGEVHDAVPLRIRGAGSKKIGGQQFTATRFLLPNPPPGYHELEMTAGRRAWRTWVISAPMRSYSEPGAQRHAGLFLPMYALRSKSNWGAGNISDWRQLMEWSASNGMTLNATLPLLAAFLDHPVCEPSPYSPASRLFWNEFYIDIERVPEFSASAAARKLVRSSAFQRQLRRFRDDALIDYAAQWKMRRQVLEILAAEFFRTSSARHSAFKRFVRNHPALSDYAGFRAACDHMKKSWRQWPERMKRGRLGPGDFPPEIKNFHLYVQWIAAEQIAELLDAGHRRGVKLYLDLPLGVNPDGYDVWRRRHCFAMDASAGAPPDSFFTLGQNWGFSPLHPERIRADRYRYVLDFLRFQMRHTGMLRVDHVMGLHRLYWIPRGLSAAQGVYVRYAADEWHALFNLESHRNQTVLVGENLGTVPPEVNERMNRHQLREMFVIQYEQQPDPDRALRNPPPLSVASINTHDMPAFAAHWRGEDIEDRRKLGLLSHAEARVERKRRRQNKAALAKFLVARGHLVPGSTRLLAVLRALLKWMTASDTETALINLEDLWLEPQPQNVPGTHTERPNWRRKTALTLEEITAHKELAALLRAIRRKPAFEQKT